MNTVVITQSGEALNPRDDWFYSINLNWIRYKTVVDGFDVDITARKRKVVTHQSETEKGVFHSPFESINEITILRYNRERGTANGDIRILNKAYTTLQSLLNAIENGDKVWDARGTGDLDYAIR